MTEVLTGPAGLARAAALLAAGELVAFGTETVYGLGADATLPSAVARIFEAKGRPHFNPLICHYRDAAAAFSDVWADELATRLAARFWPGPLTLVLKRRATCRVALLAGAGLETLAVRVPAAESAQALLAALGRPVAAPSANRSGRVSPTRAAHVLADLGGRIAAVLDSGPCPVGVESTVLDLSAGRPFLLRQGGVAQEALEAAIGAVGVGITPGQAESSRSLRSPGLMVSHYAPSLPVRLEAAEAAGDEAALVFGDRPSGGAVRFQLSAGSDLGEAAACLFDGLRALDQPGLRGIAVGPVPDRGLGRAINDRLQRAAAPRDGSGT